MHRCQLVGYLAHYWRNERKKHLDLGCCVRWRLFQRPTSSGHAYNHLWSLQLMTAEKWRHEGAAITAQLLSLVFAL